MPARRNPSLLLRVIMTMGVAVAATLASAFTLAPAANAEDATLPTDTATEPIPTPTPTDATETPGTGIEIEATGDPTDAPTTPPLTSSATQAAPSEDKKAERVEAMVVPNFGTEKVRVGVKIADGSVVPAGTTTLGTTIRITETGPNVTGGTTTTTCTTTVTVVASTETYCDFGIPGAYRSEPGSTVTIEQLTVNPNLVIDDSTPSAGPCILEEGGPPFCNDTLLLVDTVAGADDDDDDSDDDDSDEADDDESDDRDEEGAVLPDTGGADPRLLGYGVGLLIGGGSLVVGTRRRPRGKHALIH